MTSDQFKTIVEIIASIATTIAIIAAGIWAYFRFVRQRENSALIDFSVDVNFILKKDGWWIIELIAYVENKGRVQHRIKEFTFELASLDINHSVDLAPEFGNQVYFPNEIAKGSFLPSSCTYFFVEPGLKNKYSYVSRVQAEAELLMMHSFFKYLDGKHSHTAEITVKVPNN